MKYTYKLKSNMFVEFHVVWYICVLPLYTAVKNKFVICSECNWVQAGIEMIYLMSSSLQFAA